MYIIYIKNKNMNETKMIGIIGGGWYGCYIAEYLLDNYPDLNINIIDKENDIFKCSSYNNQNRLHLGFHYPRCEITMKKCNIYYHTFLKKYNNIIESIDKNIYAISNSSKVKYEDYISKYDKEKYTLLENNNNLKNIDRFLINTKEKYINFEKSKQHFLNKFKNKVNYILNYEVIEIKNYKNKVIINNNLYYDKVFNCTYNQIKIKSQEVIYEKCISLIYKKINNVFFDSLTIMDGPYFSIYKYKDDLFTLTDVENTPLIKDKDFNKIKYFQIQNLNKIINNFEDNVKKIYNDFNKNFIYHDYIISYKCKNITINDSRDLNINIDSNIFNVWCGKITFVLELNNFIDNFIKI